MRSSLAETFSAILASSVQELNLAHATLLIAKNEYPELDVQTYLLRLDEIARGIACQLPEGASDADKLLLLNHHLFSELGFKGNVHAYADPRNSYLNDVLERRLGIPITLSIVYMEVGSRLGLRLRGVSFPGHFLVKMETGNSIVIVDPFFKGAPLSRDDLMLRLRAVLGEAAAEDRLHQYLCDADQLEIIARVLRNLRAIFAAEESYERALAFADAILVLLPASGQEYRERGHIYRELECFGAAADDYAKYLEIVPQASDAEEILERVGELEHARSRLN